MSTHATDPDAAGAITPGAGITYGNECSEFDLSVCLDAGHIWLYGYDLNAAIERYRSKIRVIHLHGVENGVDHREISTLSDSQVRSVLAAAEEGAPDRVLTLEVFGETELQRSLETLRRLTT